MDCWVKSSCCWPSGIAELYRDAVSMPTTPGDDTGIIDSLRKPDTFFFVCFHSVQTSFQKRFLVSYLHFIGKGRCAVFFLQLFKNGSIVLQKKTVVGTLTEKAD